MSEKVYLQRVLKHTNINLPFVRGGERNDYISASTFPEQIRSLINKRVTIKYRDYYDYVDPVTVEKAAVHEAGDGTRVTSRPSDDVQMMEDRPLNPGVIHDYEYYKSRDFIILRADEVYPYILIGVSADYMDLIVSSTEVITEDETGHTIIRSIDDFMTVVDGKVCIIFDESAEPAYRKFVSIYPLQQLEYIGASCSTVYHDGAVDSRVIRADANEPSLSVLIEWVEEVDEQGVVHQSAPRYVLGDEIKAEFISKNSAQGGDVYDFGELESGIVTADGNYDFGDLDEGVSEDSVANGDYDFNTLAYVADVDMSTNYAVASYRKSIIEGP